jgi:amino acid adenylation domain-containing protein
MARREGATFFMTLLAGAAALLFRHTGQDDMVLGTPIANRSLPEIENLIGFFVNTLALRARLSADLPFGDLLRRIRETALAAYAHQDLPFDKLVDELNLDRSPGRPPLVQVLVGLWEEPLENLQLPGVSAAPLTLETKSAKLDLTLRFAERESGMGLQVEYSVDLFDGVTAERLLNHLARLLTSAVDPSRRLDEMPLATAGEMHQLLVEWNDTAAQEAPSLCIHELFVRQAAWTPNAWAVEAGPERLTFRELDEQSSRLARYLRRRGVDLESRVGVCLPRSAAAVVALFGIFKAGGAFVPLDPGAPKRRLESILREAGATVLVTQESLRSVLPEGLCPVISLDEEAQEIVAEMAGSPEGLAEPGSLAYVLYTSGSTGQPKGVMVEHHSVVHLLAALQAHVSPEAVAPRRVSLNAPLVFDASVKQWVQLLAGHTLVVVPEELRIDPSRMLAFLRESQVQVLDCTPSQLSALVTAGLLDEAGSLERVLVGGESLPRALWKTLSAVSQPIFFNVYGPTECTVDATAIKITEGSIRPVLGYPLPNVRIHLLDRGMNPAPLGAAGELCIGGAGVSRGYLGRPAQTAERFVPDPWAQVPGERLYRSGDLARRLPDGTLEILGRVDRQVKVRGFRIELGEIEEVLGEHPEVREVAVLARSDTPGSRSGELRLVAYTSHRRETAPAAEDLRAFLREKLPDFMMPAAFVALADLPRTRNGKIDRSALPVPEMLRERSERIQPRSPAEKVFAGIMAEVLNVDEISIHDNFFELGGNSLRVIELVTMIRDNFGVEVPLSRVFHTPTVAGLTAVLLEDSEQRRRVEEMAPILLDFATRAATD